MKEKQAFCGNCKKHHPYEYPDKIFCLQRFIENKGPIVQTLECCEAWTQSDQECYCVKDAQRMGK